MEAIWKPVAASEGFEVVRRRLFLDCKNPSAREMVCSHFSALYRENPTDFPLEVREVEYRNRLLACYPIHPEVFDRLYEDWATLERAWTDSNASANPGDVMYVSSSESYVVK